MMIGSVGFALAAGLGLSAVARRRGALGPALAAVLGGLAIVECWPSPWPRHAPPPVPPFYQQIAFERDSYAVLDLPAAWENSATASAYQYYQVTHGKPIAWGYLSRSYQRYPIEGLQSLWDPQVTDYAATRARLARLGYRFVVWHKHWPELLIGPREHGEGPPTGRPLSPDTDAFLREAFRHELPAYEDALVTVFRVARQ
jgi:hypothetical protein